MPVTRLATKASKPRAGLARHVPERRAFFERRGKDQVLCAPLDARIQRACCAQPKGQAHWVQAGGKRYAL